jgi:SAM-dependent methyltransferase
VDAELSNRVGAADERFVPSGARGELIALEHLVRYWWVSALAPGRRVLDAGCGVGYGTALLVRAGAAEAVGVDVSAEAIEAARSQPGPSFSVGDVRALEFEARAFDLVVCFEVIEHVERPDEVIAELARVLAPDGVLALSSPNRGVYPSGNPHHVHEYTPDELRAALERHFSHVALHRQHDWIASAVLADGQLGDDRLEPLADLAAAKATAEEPGSETYTIALAGRAPVSPPPARALLGGLEELREWVRLAPELEARTLERDRARADVAALRERIDQIYRDLHGSVSWRITKPLRAAATAARRFSGRRG